MPATAKAHLNCEVNGEIWIVSLSCNADKY